MPVRCLYPAATSTDAPPAPVRLSSAELRTRIVPSRFLQSSVTAPTPPRPSLNQTTALYAALYTLGTLRTQSIDSDNKYWKTLATLEEEVGALEREVGETRDRKSVV